MREIIRGGRSNPAYRDRERERNRERQRKLRALKAKPKKYKYGRKVTQKEGYFLRKYGISLEQRAELFASKGSSCGICRKSLNLDDPGTHLDHCHNTGVIRGFLCTRCNINLGWYEKVTMRRIQEYLGQYEESACVNGACELK